MMWYTGIPYLITRFLGKTFKFKDSPKLIRKYGLGTGEFKSFILGIAIIIILIALIIGIAQLIK